VKALTQQISATFRKELRGRRKSPMRALDWVR
jgi:hypothetical protein